MEIRDFARRVVLSPSLDDKLAPPPADLGDAEPGPALRVKRPVRPAELRIRSIRESRAPPIEGMPDPEQRGRIVHALANHEFQAVELFAWALLAFPETPAPFRRGLLSILEEEQAHTRMYLGCLERHGLRFGDLPVSAYFWNKIDSVETPQQFVCTMGLTFENANLDHTIEYARAARRAGDRKLARVIERIHNDEIRHVRFGWHWLRAFKDPEQGMWDAYCGSVSWPLRPALARGRRFHAAGRQEAGLDDDFIQRLARVEPQRRGDGRSPRCADPT